jgi:hypothetical protein
MLTRISNLIIIIGIYLYFVAWIYVHFYYQQFGVSTESLRIDYSAYLMFSWNVLGSSEFLSYIVYFLILIAARLLFLFIVTSYKEKAAFCRKASAFMEGNVVFVFVNRLVKAFRFNLVILFLVVLFYWLYGVARSTALDHYSRDRVHTGNLKTIQVVFRNSNEIISPTIALDSAGKIAPDLMQDVQLLKNDSSQVLKLLGESDGYYIVLNQHRVNTQLNSLPTGYVYFINKNDILFSKIILRSM